MRINQVVKNLVFVDLVFHSALGLVGPIFAIFVADEIVGGNAKVVGFAVGIYWVVKSLLQVPLARWLDKNHGEMDDFLFMVVGFVIASLATVFFAFVKLPWHIYILQTVKAIAMAMMIPAWCGIFTRHIDKGREAFNWSLDSTAVGLGAGITGALGGLYVVHFSFQSLFILAGAISFVGALIPLLIRHKMIPADKDHLVSTLIKHGG